MGRKQRKNQARINHPDNQYAYEEGHKAGFWRTGETARDHLFDKHQRQAFEQGFTDGVSDKQSASIGYKATVLSCDAAFIIGILFIVLGVTVSIVNGQGTPLFFMGVPLAVVAYVLRGVSRVRGERRARVRRRA